MSRQVACDDSLDMHPHGASPVRCLQLRGEHLRVADGRNGLRVLQLTSPDSQPKFYGFSPPPVPELIASRPTTAPALALSKGLDRDRAVDESGGQIAILGRIGSRPFNEAEQRAFHTDREGRPWFVSDRVQHEDLRPAREGPAPARVAGHGQTPPP